MDIGPSELVIILIIVILLFGGSRLAGLGKSAGRALKEFKEETQENPAGHEAISAPQSAALPGEATGLPAPESNRPVQ